MIWRRGLIIHEKEEIESLNPNPYKPRARSLVPAIKSGEGFFSVFFMAGFRFTVSCFAVRAQDAGFSCREFPRIGGSLLGVAIICLKL